MRHAGLAFLTAALVGVAACAVGTTGTKSFEDDGAGDDGGDSPHTTDGAAGGEGGAACTDTTSDPKNCGACGHACEVADAGSLIGTTDDNPDSGIPKTDAGVTEAWSIGEPACAASACGVACPASMTLCDDHICYETSTFHEHCGDCNTACPSAQYCSTGHCCDPGKAYCNTACIDVLSNNVNCGTCGNECAVGEACVAGKCSDCVTNEALTATATSSGGGTTTYGPDIARDNVVEAATCSSFAWVTASDTAGTSWIQYTWSSAKTVTKMHMDTLSATVTNSCSDVGRTLGAATVQWWNGASWITDGTVTSKTDDWDYTFSAPVMTTQVRLYAIYCTNTTGQTTNPVIFEWQVTGCN